MNADGAASVVFLGLFLLIPTSALLARRLPRGTVIKAALIWAALFLVAWAIVAHLT